MSIIPPGECVSNNTLAQLVKQLIEKRGTPESWQQKHSVLLLWIVSSEPNFKAFCRGEVHADYHYPAVLGYDQEANTVKVYAPSGENNTIMSWDPKYFQSSIPYSGIVNEVLKESTNPTGSEV